MTIEYLREFLGWCTLVNFSVMLIWFTAFIFAHDWIYKLHKRWFNLAEEKFDAIHYSGMAIYKMSIYLFNFIPFLVLWFMG